MMVTRRTAAARQVQFQKIDIHTKVVLGVLAIGAFAALYAIVCGAADLLLFDRIGRGEEIPDAELIAWQVRRDQAGKAVLGTFIFASIAWAAWTFLFLRNAKTLSNAETRYTPIWSTVSIFVPIVNLWYPYAAIMDAAHRSAGAARWWKLVFLWSIVGPWPSWHATGSGLSRGLRPILSKDWW